MEYSQEGRQTNHVRNRVLVTAHFLREPIPEMEKNTH